MYISESKSSLLSEINDLTLGRSKIVLERGFTPLKTIIEAYTSNGHIKFS